MLGTNGVTVRFGKRVLYEDVNVKFTPGNCYRIIGANGAGKSTFLKLLSGEIDTTTGEVNISKGERLSVLKQDHNIYNDYRVLDVVIMGNKRLYEMMEEKNKVFTKEDFIIEADKAINDDNISEEKEELLEDEELSILNNAFNFDTISVSQVLKKRDEIFALDINNLTIDKLNQIILENNYSRIPIYDEKIDNIIGILTVRTYFKEYMADKHLNIVGCLTKPLYFEESTKVDEIFEEFNKTKNHLGFVVDKNKNLVGMVTMDDILEELVGDIDEIKINKLKENKHERKSN